MGPRWNGYIPIAREGMKFFVPVVLAAALAIWLSAHWLVGTALVTLAGFILFFFRNPQRHSTAAPAAIVSPADGVVMSAETLPPRTDGALPRFKIAIFMSILDVHINRAPMAGAVTEINYTPGRHALAFLPKESEDNERNTILIEQSDRRRAWVTQIAGTLARRIVCYAQKDMRICRGERIGLIQFGSRVDITIEGVIQVTTRAGDRVKGGESVLAYFEHPLS